MHSTHIFLTHTFPIAMVAVELKVTVSALHSNFSSPEAKAQCELL